MRFIRQNFFVDILLDSGIGRRNISLGKRASEEQKETLIDYLEDRVQLEERDRGYAKE